MKERAKKNWQWAKFGNKQKSGFWKEGVRYGAMLHKDKDKGDRIILAGSAQLFKGASTTIGRRSRCLPPAPLPITLPLLLPLLPLPLLLPPPPSSPPPLHAWSRLAPLRALGRVPRVHHAARRVCRYTPPMTTSSSLPPSPCVTPAHAVTGTRPGCAHPPRMLSVCLGCRGSD